jgi:hypothetical protein
MNRILMLVILLFGAAITSSAQANLSYTIFGSVDGSISFGTKTFATDYLLSVNGKVMTGGTRVLKHSAWPDYVFEYDYFLMPLPDLKKYIDINHHLPGVPDAATISKTGTDVAETSAMLLKKTEELTLYLLQLDERLKKLEKKE